jgi:hypothetical protein
LHNMPPTDRPSNSASSQKNANDKALPRSRSPHVPVTPSGGVGGIDISAAVEQAFDKSRDKFIKALSEPVAEMSKSACAGVMQEMSNRLGAVEASQQRLETGHKEVLDQLAGIKESLQKMSHSKSVPNLSPSVPTPSSSNYDVTCSSFYRKLDPTILFCNVHGQTAVSRDVFYKEILKLTAEANVGEEDFNLVGDVLDSRYELQFLGPSAERLCYQFFHSLTLGRGKRKTTEVLDPQGTKHTFYVNVDKNPAQIRKEVLSKGLREIISPLLPANKELFVRKSTGSIMVDRRVVVSVVIVNETETTLSWNHAKSSELGLVEADIMQQFLVVAGGTSP